MYLLSVLTVSPRARLQIPPHAGQLTSLGKERSRDGALREGLVERGRGDKRRWEEASNSCARSLWTDGEVD
eukprot:COSAG03_NODE_1728_length_3597_cov_7.751572_2_plen_71_part_00